MYCQEFNKRYGLPVTCLRYFSVYGPRQKPGPYSGAICSFVDNLFREKPLPLFGDGNQTRDFVYVDDVTRASILAFSRAPSKPEVFNVCTGVPTRIIDMVSILRDLTGRAKAQTIPPPSRNDEIEHSFGDYSKAKSALG